MVEITKIGDKSITASGEKIGLFKNGNLICFIYPRFDRISITYIEYAKQSLAKVVSNIYLEHPQVIDYQSQSLTKTVSIIDLEHPQVVNYVSQSLTKEVAEITLSPS